MGARVTGRLCIALATGLWLLTAAGCGSSGPSAVEQRAAWGRWARQADAICRRTEAAIVRRGGPTGMRDTGRIARQAAIDVHAAVAALRRLPPPAGSAGRARALLAAAGRIEPALARVSRSTRDGRADHVVAAASGLREQAYQFEFQSRRAGLHDCGRAGQREGAADALTAPAYAAQAGTFHVLFARRITRLMLRTSRTSETWTEFSDRYARATTVVYAWQQSFENLEPPASLHYAAERYSAALGGMARVLSDASEQLDHGDPGPAALDRLDARFVAAARRADRRVRSLLRRLRRAAAPRPGHDGGPEDPTAPAGGDGESSA